MNLGIDWLPTIVEVVAACLSFTVMSGFVAIVLLRFRSSKDAEFFLRMLVGRAVSEAISGDLQHMLQRDRKRFGPRRALILYWREVLLVVFLFSIQLLMKPFCLAQSRIARVMNQGKRRPWS
jgi:hypothetical protein